MSDQPRPSVPDRAPVPAPARSNRARVAYWIARVLEVGIRVGVLVAEELGFRLPW